MNLRLFDIYIGEGGIARPSPTHPDITHWRRVARAALARDGRCRCCGVDQNLRCHHITYERFGVELIDDVTTLCEDCHTVIHAVLNARRRLIRKWQARLEQGAAGQYSLME